MINLRVDLPVKQDVVDLIQLKIAQIRDELVEIEELMRNATQERILLTKEEVQKFLRVEKVPPAIKKIRCGNKWLYERQDVYNFIDSKKR